MIKEIKNNKSLIHVELNEINFDFVKEYLDSGVIKLPNLKHLLDGHVVFTESEKKYSLLEPWIQWVSVHTGLSFSQHKVFRLGDVVNLKQSQIFEIIEKNGLSVGSISVMNAVNRLKNPDYFIPDPWTNTSSDSSFWSRVLSKSLKQAVNDNAKSKLNFETIFFISIGFFRFAKFKHYPIYTKLILSSFRSPWSKALFLDLFLHDIHLTLVNSKKPNFSTIFLNAGAHIQHHYLFNSSVLKDRLKIKNPKWYLNPNADPIADTLKIYDSILGDYLKSFSNLIISTGLSQIPYDSVMFYYKLNNYDKFLKKFNINYINISPRMTRDFLIEFENRSQTKKAMKILSSIKIINDNKLLFEEIDNRGTSLFVSLTYSDYINQDTEISFYNKKNIKLLPFVTFIAIKNGMHHQKGFAFFSSSLKKIVPRKKIHVKNIFNIILNFFEINY